jgi:hypothetical protein
MQVYTVTKDGGTKDPEYKAYVQLLSDSGIDLAQAPRVPEPDTNRRWLYVWDDAGHAERFAEALRIRTGDRSWRVYPFEEDGSSIGPVAPLDIYTVREIDGTIYFLDPPSRERIVRHAPHPNLYASLFLSDEDYRGLLQQYGQESWWHQVCKHLTGLSDEYVKRLGGYRLFKPDGSLWYEDKLELLAS